jgi:hypothetical protein
MFRPCCINRRRSFATASQFGAASPRIAELTEKDRCRWKRRPLPRGPFDPNSGLALKCSASSICSKTASKLSMLDRTCWRGMGTYQACFGICGTCHMTVPADTSSAPSKCVADLHGCFAGASGAFDKPFHEADRLYGWLKLVVSMVVQRKSLKHSDGSKTSCGTLFSPY